MPPLRRCWRLGSIGSGVPSFYWSSAHSGFAAPETGPGRLLPAQSRRNRRTLLTRLLRTTSCRCGAACGHFVLLRSLLVRSWLINIVFALVVTDFVCAASAYLFSVSALQVAPYNFSPVGEAAALSPAMWPAPCGERSGFVLPGLRLLLRCRLRSFLPSLPYMCCLRALCASRGELNMRRRRRLPKLSSRASAGSAVCSSFLLRIQEL